MVTEETSVNNGRIHTNVVRASTQRLQGERESKTKYDEDRMCTLAGAAYNEPPVVRRMAQEVSL